MYTVKLLDDKDFEALPYPDMDVSLGVADPNTKTAYGRRTGIPVVDIFTLAHELEHLEDGHEGEHADHFENGVYYKKMSQVFSPMGAASGIAMAGGNPFGALAGFMPLLGGGKGSGQQEQSQDSSMSGFGQSQGMPAMQQAQAPNVIQTGQSGTGFGGGGGMGASGGIRSDMELARTALDRNKGFYSGRGGF